MIKSKKINLSWMMELYKNHPNKDKFFDRIISRQVGNIDYLIGDGAFKNQIAKGWSEEKNRKIWEPGIAAYKKMRKQYLLYP